MANGLDFSTIYGAGQGGVEQGQDLMSFLGNLLSTGGYGQWNQGMMGLNSPGEDYLQSLMGMMGGSGQSYQDIYEGLGIYEDANINNPQQSLLYSLMGGTGLFGTSGLMSGYSQDMGSINEEMKAKTMGLQKGYGLQSKGGRYGNIGTGGRSKGQGTRKQYMSDLYGIQQQQAEMQSSLQDQFMDDFYTNISQWQVQNQPALPTGDDNG